MASTRKRPPKAEASYVAHHRKAVVRPAHPKKPSKRTKRALSTVRRHFFRSFRLRRTTTVVAMLCAGIAFWIATVLVFIYFDRNVQQQQTDSVQDMNGKRAFEALYGSEADRLSEIENGANIDQDLQAYVLRDYTELKKQCVVNGQYVYVPRYRIEAVVRGQFAKIVRDCGGPISVVLARADSGWVEVFRGNNEPSCELVNQFGIPRRIAANCVFDGVVYTNPNAI